jgi:hypothetical protein
VLADRASTGRRSAEHTVENSPVLHTPPAEPRYR